MKISIITVVYNNEKTIRDAIQSVLNQTYTNVEYILIDGDSSDNTLDFINEFKHKISYILSEKDKGLYDAMNKGLKIATGDVIGILNSDDLYQDSEVISAVMEEFNNDTSLNIVYGDLVYVKSEDTNKVIRYWKSKSYFTRFFENANVPPHPSLFVRSVVYKEIGLFDLQFKLAADYELMLRMFKKHNFKSKYINRLIIRMRLGGTTNESYTNVINQNIEIFKAWKKNDLQAPYYLMPLRIIKRLSQFI